MKIGHLTFGFRSRLLLMGALCVLGLSIWADTARAQYQVTTLGTAVTENFSSLGMTTGAAGSINFNAALGSTNAAQRASAWAFNGFNSTFFAGDDNGTVSAGGLRVTALNNTTADRSLGFLGTGSGAVANGNIVAQFSNATGSAVTSLVIDFAAEWWRQGGTRPSLLTVQYSIGATPGTYTSISSLNYNVNSLINGSNTARNGDADGNRTLFSPVTLNVTVANGESLWIKWSYNGNADGTGAGSKQTFAIDDVSVTFNSNGGPVSLTWTGSSGTWDTATAAWQNTVANDTVWSNTVNSATTAVFAGAGATSIAVDAAGVTASGLRFDNTGYMLGGSGAITLTGGVTQVTNSSDVATVNSVVAGVNGLNKTGAGKLILGGNNTFTGDVTVTAGTLSISSDANLGASTNAVALNGGTLQSTATMALGSTRVLSGTGSLAPIAGTTLTVSGAVNATSLNIADEGTVALAGTTGTKTLAALSFSSAGTVAVTGDALSLPGSVTTTHTSGTATLSGPVNLGTGVRAFVVADGSSNIDLLVSGNLSGAATILKTGAGTLSLTGNNSTLVGNGTIPASIRLGSAGAATGGTIAFDNSNALGTGQIQFNYGTLQADNAVTLANSWSIGGRAGSGMEAVLAGADITATGGWGFFGVEGTGFGLNINNNTTFSGNIDNITGTTSTLALGGTGNFTLSGNNAALTEVVTIKDTLTVNAASSTAFGAGSIVVNTGATLKIATGVFLPNTISLAGGTLNKAVTTGSSYSLTVNSTVPGGRATVASVLAGDATTDTAIVSTFSATPSGPVDNDGARVSDVLNFSGTGSDLFVLQLTYDEAAALLAGGENNILLGYLSGGAWVNAVNANTGLNNASGSELGYQGDFITFQLDFGSDLTAYQGAYGIDTSANAVWAVINHNSEFAAFSTVPEPSTYALLGVGLGVLWLGYRRKSGSGKSLV